MSNTNNNENNNIKFYSPDEIVESIPYKAPFSDVVLICKNKETFDYYSGVDEDNKVPVDSSNTLFINKNLIIDLLDDDQMWSYFSNLCDIDVDFGCDIIYIQDDKEEHIKLTKNQVGYALNLLIGEVKTQSRCALASYILSLDFCREYYSKRFKKWRCYIDNTLKQIPIEELLNILTWPEDTFNEFINKKVAYGMSMEEVVFILVRFVDNQNVLDKYLFPQEAIDRFHKIKNYEYVDYEAVNKYSKYNPSNTSEEDKKGIRFITRIINNTKNTKNVSCDTNTGDYVIHSRLKKRIFEDMNQEYDSLEKAIFIYFRLCDLLSENETMVFKKDNYIKESVDYNRLETISAYNNRVVSSEFILIYSKLLSELGIIYAPHIDCTIGFDTKYSYLEFKQAEYMVKVDLFNQNAIKNDMTQVKIGQGINGITCINTNEVTKSKFNDKLDMVYRDYIELFDKKALLNDTIEAIYEEDQNNPVITIDDKVKLVLLKAKLEDITGIDFINFVQVLIDSVLDENEYVTYRLLNKNTDIPSMGHQLVISTSKNSYLITLGKTKILNCFDNEQFDEILAYEDINISEYDVPVKER